MYFLIAISLGFLGSFHCIGMCGPIALAIPVKNKSFWSLVFASSIYNMGRVVTYSILGFFFGLIGKGFAIAGWQNILSVSLGCLLLGFVFYPQLKFKRLNAALDFLFLDKIKNILRKLFAQPAYFTLFSIGLLNGLLPCGLVYLGIAGSMSTSDPFQGSMFMAAFGLGTLPAMLAVSFARNFIGIRFREKIRQSIPVMVGLMAVLLILRGMNLGIPYVSPSLENHSGILHHQCCKMRK